MTATSRPPASPLEATTPGVNATVSASAGTGKTWLLVARLLRLLLAGETPASILAITFTQKAAAEIRERLTVTLREWTRAGDAALNEELASIGAAPAQARRARELYETLIYSENDIRILTFHAFCTEILKRFPLEASSEDRAPPGFEICSEEWELQEEALNRLYVEAAGDQEPSAEDTRRALRTLFETCGGLSNTNLALGNFLAHRNDWLACTEGAQDPAQDATLRLGEMLGVEPGDAENDVALDDDTRELLKTYARLVSLHDNKANRKYAGAINAFLESGAEVNEETLPPLLDCFFKQDGGKREKEFTSKTFLKSLGPATDEFTTASVMLTDTLTKVKNIVLKRRTFRRNRAWYAAGQRLTDIYRELKLSRRQLDFNDLEWLACRLVNHEDDAQWIQYRLNERIRHILVDEFQDTNPQQWQLLKPLLEEMASQEGGGSAFIVGDTKQSIYGFRRASPELQDEATQWLQQRMDGQIYTTDVSRRSSPEVIEFVNRVFSDDASPALPDFRPHGTERETPGGVFVLPFAEKRKTAEQPREWRDILRDPPLPGDDHPAQKEGGQIAECIAGLADRCVAVHDRDGKTRPLRFGDVTLLLRTRRRLDYYEQALTKAGIPHGSGRAEKMFNSLEIADMLALLELLVNHERNLSLAQVLRSPMFSAGDEQLITLSQTAGDCWFTRLGRLEDDRGLRRAHELLSDWIEAARTRLPAHDVLDRVYRESDLIRRYRLAAPEGEEDLVEKNLVELLDYALEFESGRYPDIAHFARHLKHRIARARSSSATSAGTEPDDPDRVRILTIHQAKGLEAPVVILADCGGQRQRHDAYSVLADWPTGSVRPEHFLLVSKSGHMDSFTEECRQRLHERDAREAANLLYVALTRARQYLFISGSGDKPETGWYGLLKPHVPEPAPTLKAVRDDARAETALDAEAGGTPDAAPDATPRHQPLPPPPALEMHPNALVGTAPDSSPGGRIDDEDGKLRGQVIHHALKLLSEQTGESELQSEIAGRFPQAAEQLHEWLESARALIADESLHELFDDARYEQTLNETPISFIHDGEQYFGVIDRMCVGRDTVWIVDYKTHRSTDRAEDIKAHYAEQMHAYYLGAIKLWPGRTIRTSLLLTENQQLCDYHFDAPRPT